MLLLLHDCWWLTSLRRSRILPLSSLICSDSLQNWLRASIRPWIWWADSPTLSTSEDSTTGSITGAAALLRAKCLSTAQGEEYAWGLWNNAMSASLTWRYIIQLFSQEIVMSCSIAFNWQDSTTAILWSQYGTTRPEEHMHAQMVLLAVSNSDRCSLAFDAIPCTILSLVGERMRWA